MKIIGLAFALYLALGVSEFGASAPRVRCEYGRVQGFMAVRPSPSYIVGTIPSRFTDRPGYFARRYNCARGNVLVRRVDLGTYDVKFPGLNTKVALASATSAEGVAASVTPIDRDTYRVALRGPLSDNDVLLRRDVPFSIAVF